MNRIGFFKGYMAKKAFLNFFRNDPPGGSNNPQLRNAKKAMTSSYPEYKKWMMANIKQEVLAGKASPDAAVTDEQLSTTYSNGRMMGPVWKNEYGHMWDTINIDYPSNKKDKTKSLNKEAFTIIPSWGGQSYLTNQGLGLDAGYSYMLGAVPFPHVGVRLGGEGGGTTISGPIPGIGIDLGQRPGWQEHRPRSIYKYIKDKSSGVIDEENRRREALQKIITQIKEERKRQEQIGKTADRQPLDMPPAGEPEYVEGADMLSNEQAKLDMKYKKDTRPQARAQQKGTGYE